MTGEAIEKNIKTKSNCFQKWWMKIMVRTNFISNILLISWEHRLNASSFSYSLSEATLWLLKLWRIPLRKVKFYFGPSVWFCLQSNFTFLTLRKMFNDRFGSFSYQIKLSKFYKFLALSWRIYPPVGETQNNQHKKPLGKPKQKESQIEKSPIQASFACHRIILLSSRTVFPVMQWELSNLPAILIG